MISKYVIQSKRQQVLTAVDTPRQAVSFIKNTFGILKDFDPKVIKEDCNVSFRHKTDLANVVTVKQVTGTVNINQFLSIYVYPAWLKLNGVAPTEEGVFMMKDPRPLTNPFSPNDIFHYHATLVFILKRAKKHYTCKFKTYLVLPYYSADISKDKALMDVFKKDISLPYGESYLRSLIYPLLSKTDPLMGVVRL